MVYCLLFCICFWQPEKTINMLERRGSPIDMLAQSPPFDEIIVRLIMTHCWEFTNYHFQVIMEQKYLGQESFKNCMGCNFSEILTAVVSGVVCIKCNCCAFFSLQTESTPLIFKPSRHQTNSQSVWWQYLYLYFFNICICVVRYLYTYLIIVIFFTLTQFLWE